MKNKTPLFSFFFFFFFLVAVVVVVRTHRSLYSFLALSFSGFYYYPTHTLVDNISFVRLAIVVVYVFFTTISTSRQIFVSNISKRYNPRFKLEKSYVFNKFFFFFLLLLLPLLLLLLLLLLFIFFFSSAVIPLLLLLLHHVSAMTNFLFFSISIEKKNFIPNADLT